MKHTTSIYVRNKQDPEAIIYLGNDGSTIRLTREDFGSEEEFNRWKEWSDQQYKDEGKRERAYLDRKVSLMDRDQPSDYSTGTEDLLFEQMNRLSHQAAADACVHHIREILTVRQYRRLWLYGVLGMTEEEIARMENVSHQAISKSLRAAMQRVSRIKKDFVNFL